MKQIKFGILGAGVLGIIAIFLPFISMGPMSVSLWKMRAMGESGQVYLVMGCFAVGAVMGALAVKGKQLARWQSIVALVVYGLTLFKMRGGLSGPGTAIGAKLIFVAALIGVIAAVVGTAKPEKA